MKNKIRQNALYATVAASAIVLYIASNTEAIAQVNVNYHGTQEQYDDLQTDPTYDWWKSVRPPASAIQSDNTVNVSDQDDLGDDFVAPYNVYGGFDSGSGTAITVNNNSVVISGGIIQSNVYGGVGFGNGEAAITVSGNSVDISSGEIGGDVYGGSGSGYISSDSTLMVSGNNVIISGGTIEGSVFGGVGQNYGYDGNTNIIVTDNSVVISEDSVVNYDVYGGEGYGYGTSIVSDNRVTISGSAVTGNVYGGVGASYGDESSSNTVSGNLVVISGSAVTGDVYGGESYSYGSSTVSDNRVIISENAVTGSIVGGMGTGETFLTVSGNQVSVSGGEVGGDIYGGSGSGYVSSDSVLMVSGNSVDVSGGTIDGDIYAGYGLITDYGDGGNGLFTVTDNRIVITGGTINGSIYGGYGDAYIYYNDAGEHGTLTVNDNSIIISGGAIEGNVYGGAVFDQSYIDSSTFTVSATNNTVTLKNSASIQGSIYGGYGTIDEVEITDWNKVVAGNTLNVIDYSGSVAGIKNFENYNWVLPKTAVNNGSIIQIMGPDAVNLDKTNHTIAVVNDGTRMKVNDTIVMIDKANGDPASVPAKVPDEIRQGHFIIYDVDVKIDDENKFILKVLGVEDEDGGRINSSSKALLEGRAAALGFVAQGSDLIATAGIDNIRMMVRKDAETKGLPLIPFMIMQGASNRYKTGSHADVDGFNMATGLATGGEFGQGNKVTLGAFFEYGRGTYDTYNNFNSGYVHGSGDVNYTGGGIFGRLDFDGSGLGRVANLTPTQADGLYLEASLRAGRVSMGFDSDDLIDPEGFRGNYNSKVGYLGGHASAGYVFNFDEQNALDVYARALWTRMNGDTVSVGKDTLHFDKSTSSRLQLGGRYSYVYSDQFKPYLGAAFEHELKGDIGATAYGFRVDEPSLKGSTGIVEAGFSYMPNVKIPDLSINLNAQAFFGQRQGGSGQIKLKYQF